jgi:hypothetical protein
MGVPLPIAEEIDTRLVPHPERHDSAGAGRMQSAVLFAVIPGLIVRLLVLAYQASGIPIEPKMADYIRPTLADSKPGPSRDKGELPGGWKAGIPDLRGR